MTKCWKDEPIVRPSFENLRNDLKEMESLHEVNSRVSKRHSPYFFVSKCEGWSKLRCCFSKFTAILCLSLKIDRQSIPVFVVEN